jgi:predicted GNAT family acetyltransferase
VDFAAIQAYLRDSVAQGRDCEHVGPFLASFSPRDANPFFNYAIPEDAAAPSHQDVAALIEAYERRSRKPRLEYIADLAPAVEPALLAAGFTVEGRLALMGLDPDAARGLATQTGEPAAVELIEPVSRDDFRAVRAVQHEAYEDPSEPVEDEVESIRRSLALRGGAVLARMSSDHVAAGAGEYSPIIEGVTEVTSIGVRPAYRRRGIAAAVVAWLAEDARESGATTLFLMANESEERLYSRVGFVTGGRVLHISR